MPERCWSDDDRELVKRAAVSVPRPGEGAWLNAGTFSRYWDEVTSAVLEGLTAAGWRKVTGVITFDDPVTAEEAERFRAEFERAARRPVDWAYEVHVRRLPRWRRILRRRRG